MRRAPEGDQKTRCMHRGILGSGFLNVKREHDDILAKIAVVLHTFGEAVQCVLHAVVGFEAKVLVE